MYLTWWTTFLKARNDVSLMCGSKRAFGTRVHGCVGCIGHLGMQSLLGSGIQFRLEWAETSILSSSIAVKKVVPFGCSSGSAG